MFYYYSKSCLEIGEISSLGVNEISKLWSGEFSKSSLKYSLAIDPDNIFFLADWSLLNIGLPKKSCQFKEGLWENDVIELFVKDEGEQYLEFNLNSDGDWWACSFSSSRKRNNLNLSSLASSFVFPEKKRSLLKINYQDFFLDKDFLLPRTLNVTSCLNGSYYSECKLLGPKPDFHQPSCWKKAQIVRI